MGYDIIFRDENLVPIWNKIQHSERLAKEDGLTLFQSNDLLAIGKMARCVQSRLNGDSVYFAVNQKIEPTNICVLTCKFCDFGKKIGTADAYEMSIAEILNKISPDINEVHITGGLHPEWEWKFYLDMLKSIKQKYPSIEIKAFTAVEIDYFHRKFRLSIEEVILQLKEAGLSTLPGGGAEVFSERVKNELFHQKIGEQAWLDIHRTAHLLGVPSNCTILYGHIESDEERIDHLLKLRELQDETNGFLSFVPLAFQPGETGIKPSGEFTSAIVDLKMIAISRLILDNIPHIKAYWVMLTEEVASLALDFGADDMEGTVGGEKIAHDAGAITPMTLAKDRLIKIIKDAGKIPVERDVFYNPIDIYSDKVIGKIPYINSIPYYEKLEKRDYRLLSASPRRLGMFAKKEKIDAGLFSLVDYFAIRDYYDEIGFGIATRDQVKSVMLFSNHGWRDLEGKTIGITDDTSTSVKLLELILKQRYGVNCSFVRIRKEVDNLSSFDAVLLIGDTALRMTKARNVPFEIVYDLAKEWYEWQRLPFVFAVWAVKKSIDKKSKETLTALVRDSLERGKADIDKIVRGHLMGARLSNSEAVDYLAGFNYRLGEREYKAISTFESLLQKTEVDEKRK